MADKGEIIVSDYYYIWIQLNINIFPEPGPVSKDLHASCYLIFPNNYGQVLLSPILQTRKLEHKVFPAHCLTTSTKPGDQLRPPNVRVPIHNQYRALLQMFFCCV